MINLTLSIVSHGQFNLIEDLLDDLDAHPSLFGLKVLLTINLPEQCNLKNYKNIDVVIYYNLAPKGFGANHNQAFEHCNTEWFGVLNPDLRLLNYEPFTQILDKHKYSDKKIGVIAPQIVDEYGNIEDSIRQNLTPWSVFSRLILGSSRGFFHERKNQGGHNFFWLAGMCLVINTRAYKEIAGFDESYFLYCEDYDICARLRLAGYKLIYDASCSIIHSAQRKSHNSFKYLYWHISSLLRLWVSVPFWKITLKSKYLD